MRNLWALSLFVIIAPLMIFGFYKDNTSTSVKIMDGVDKHKMLEKDLVEIGKVLNSRVECSGIVRYSSFHRACIFFGVDMSRDRGVVESQFSGLGWEAKAPLRWCKSGVMVGHESGWKDSGKSALFNSVYNSHNSLVYCSKK